MSLELPEPAEIQRIYRLIHELCEIGGDTYAWRQHMMTEMLPIVGATSAISYTFRFSLDANDIGPKTLVYTEVGLNDAWRQYLATGDLSSDPITPHIMQRIGTDFCVSRDQWVDDQTWYASEYYQKVRIPSEIDDTIYSQIAVNDPSVMDGLSFCRGIGEPKFSKREIALTRFLHQELGRLWNRPDPIGIHVLPARQREVLDGIRRGESRKSIAEKMGVSTHTVHTYEKALFERAGVASRGELLAKLAGVIRPNLLP
jgi:DNA-binding CsgD family transcriptional regulator